MQCDEGYDIVSCIRFIWKHRIIYAAAILLVMALTIVYDIFCVESVYESKAVLYYPEVTSERVEYVSSRELMDDAIAVMSQKVMMAEVERDTGISWERIQEGFHINGDQAEAESGEWYSC
ncbi:Wzz/FepE/Etk N-terminal domain-containing protein [Bariatricus sp. SGI.154]|uniref:Wzz/FepE/Etk N-terminal domain-containing protein n=1 Tax=Bariatricus sp. SGI.154 TaxID=3420549 RepID=UPI003CFD7B11